VYKEGGEEEEEEEESNHDGKHNDWLPTSTWGVLT